MTLKRENFIPDEGEGGDTPPPPPPRPRYRPPVGIPEVAGPRREATMASLLLHIALIVIVLLPPIWVSRQIDAVQQRGPKGDGRAGGGGGGNNGTGGAERIRFLSVPEPGTPPMVIPDQIPPPIPPPPKEEKPPEPPKPPPPPVQEQKLTADTASKGAVQPQSIEQGVGGGAGKDGSAGSGVGSGGGTGSGVGTGKGSGVGSGTGAGNDDSEIYPPSVIALPILPLPVPKKVRPYKMVAYFEVDTLGNATLLDFNPSNDRGYNKRIREMLSEIRFRPAVMRSGRAVLDTAIVTAEAPRG